MPTMSTPIMWWIHQLIEWSHWFYISLFLQETMQMAVQTVFSCLLFIVNVLKLKWVGFLLSSNVLMSSWLMFDRKMSICYNNVVMMWQKKYPKVLVDKLQNWTGESLKVHQNCIIYLWTLLWRIYWIAERLRILQITKLRPTEKNC